MKLLNLQDNSLVSDYTDADRKVVSGEYAVSKGEIEVLSPDGKKGFIPSNNIKEAINQGYKLYTPDLKKQDELKSEYGETLGSELTATGLAGLRGLTFGISDQVLTQLEIMKPEALKAYRDLNPTSSLIGEIGGTVGPALLSGGTSLIAKGASKTLPALALKAGTNTSKVVAKGLEGKLKNKAVSKIVEKSASVGAGSAVEAALYGGGQLLTEDALGDAEFNAENLMVYATKTAALGGTIGGTIPLIGSAISKTASGTKKIIGEPILRSMGISAKEAREIVSKQQSAQQLSDLSEKLKNINVDSQKVQDAADLLSITPTKGMVSQNRLVGELESSLAQAPTLAGQKVAREVDEVYQGLSNTIDDVVDIDAKTMEQLTPYEVGNKIKSDLVKDIENSTEAASMFYKEIDDKFGETAVSDHMKKLHITKLGKSKQSRFFKSSKVSEVQDAIAEIRTINDVKFVRSEIGKKMSAAWRQGDSSSYEVYKDSYDMLTRMREKAIIENSKNSAEVIEGLNIANKLYADVYNEFGEVSKALGIGKIRGISQLKQSIQDIDSETLSRRFLAKGKFEKNQKLQKLAPEAFQTTRKLKLKEIYEKSLTGGEISPKKFINNLKKLNPEDQDMIFGADKRETLEALETLVNSIPDKVGPSGTSQANDLLNFFTVYTQGRDALRYILYKRGEKGINKYLNQTVDVFKDIEKAANQGRVMINDSVSSFVSGVKQAPTTALLNAGESRNYEDAIKQLVEYEQDADKAVEEIANKNEALFENAPETSRFYSEKTMQVFQFLKEKMPPSHEEVGFYNTYKPSRSAKSKFMRYYNYANKPQIVFEELKNGSVNPEGVETLRTLYPRMYEGLYSEVIEQTADMKNLSYKQKRSLYKLLAIVGASSLIPQNLQMLQGQMIAQAQRQEDMKQNKNNLRVTGLKDIEQSDRFKTKLDKLT